jgi:hypothetical protein
MDDEADMDISSNNTNSELKLLLNNIHHAAALQKLTLCLTAVGLKDLEVVHHAILNL